MKFVCVVCLQAHIQHAGPYPEISDGGSMLGIFDPGRGLTTFVAHKN